MGTSYTFTCNKCGYQVESSGKLDYGMLAVVEPHICRDCNELSDVVVGTYGHKTDKKGIIADAELNYYKCCNCKSDNITVWDARKIRFDRIDVKSIFPF